MDEKQKQTYFKELKLVPDELDIELHKLNCCPEIITQRLHKLVPLLEFVNCRVKEVSLERTVLSLPFLGSAMNQNSTHQAAVFYLAADYALGVGIFGVLPGIYVTGVHDRCAGLPVKYWLKNGSVKHLAPGVGDMHAEVSISPENAFNLRRKLVKRGRGKISEIVHIYQEGCLIAEAQHTMGIYADIPQ
jgi:acyl-coenzyme A thioesterase PaaI-like protein